ncbi:ubiquinol-cytochrome C chaperone family protein [Flammeovirga kamogawensis]|uniref:DUF3944 domain-containing protein n=1 Tax=Flammeovirga kamogawensis TaxID=373891 RepID=A0ABX8H0W6_9BACT|nr:ubiquinol-cytochrome C chaperone family protein [Flammeovirga kamogawensis]MBB6462270.1 uncharacterized protein YaaW (UPF0174 family) [Flammeovirga kamogawensis]QWG09334.1 hypothetical protein KM029_22270 [Flammeovirga kamogawensis]TRX64856.1 hypothetical protein EO216_20180 [Flammeovirga kamogawensis]
MNYYNTLNLLKTCNNEDLQFLVDKLEDTETNKLISYESYEKHKNNPKMYVDAIYNEIREFGGNTFMNLYRGKGVPYKEVITDVAKHLKVENRSSDLIELERQVLAKVLESAIENLSEKEKDNLFSELSQKDIDLSKLSHLSYLKILTTNPYVLQQTLKYFLSFGAKNIGSKAFMMAGGPIGWIATGAWLAFDLSSPAKRVTIPCVIHIAALRLSRMNDDNNKKYNKYM